MTAAGARRDPSNRKYCPIPPITPIANSSNNWNGSGDAQVKIDSAPVRTRKVRFCTSICRIDGSLRAIWRIRMMA